VPWKAAQLNLTAFCQACLKAWLRGDDDVTLELTKISRAFKQLEAKQVLTFYETLGHEGNRNVLKLCCKLLRVTAAAAAANADCPLAHYRVFSMTYAENASSAIAALNKAPAPGNGVVAAAAGLNA
jgi:hypothetical protein